MATTTRAPQPDLRTLSGVGDAEADALVGELMQRAGGGSIAQAAELERLLLGLLPWRPGSPVPEPSAPIRDFLEAPDPFPSWCASREDFDRIDRAQTFFGRYRLTSLLILGCASLPHCYCDREIARTLIVSGRLASQVRQRLGETADFLTAVMAQGSLQPGADGLRWIRKVRLIHAVMRGLTLQDPDNHRQRRGNTLAGFLLKRKWTKGDLMPIDQVELSFVLLTFSLVVLKGWESLGVEVTPQLHDDYLFTWAVIGHILGVRDELLPRAAGTAMRDAEALFAEYKRSEPGTEEGRLLTATLQVLLIDTALRDAKAFPLPSWLSWTRPLLIALFRTLPRSLIRELVGTDTAAALWVEPAPFLQRFPHWMLIKAISLRDQITRSRSEPVEKGLWTTMGMQVERLGRARGARGRDDDTRPQPSAS